MHNIFRFLGTNGKFVKILVNSGGSPLLSMNKCDICQLEVHGVEVYPLYSTSPRQVARLKEKSCGFI